MALGFVVAQGVQQHVVGLDLVGDDFDFLDAETLEGFELAFGELFAGANQGLAGFFVDDVFDEDGADEIFSSRRYRPVLDFGLKKRRRIWVVVPCSGKGTQETGRGDLVRLVDLDLELIFVGRFDLDPRTALGDDAAGVDTTAVGGGLGRRSRHQGNAGSG